ncbi:proclavaminate amidinohydrolase [Verticillium dahliae VdLs.17]|uniref:Proclavaminate amidinohydrolase n=1 Tax=Verticillium dahliae (strain VdLs.17 / ATCC MYA-4575 / FGSC 10137) TaxID=498257 RepID=G2WTK8_VERDV|nr:proclavaminate amidinohydrolase [Verticillium dahliae VdLs.17]EGY17449.1 proclavaminate amidinohydrolase [Verticillium dahliae VdLs.17]KAH6665046.1 proclavaminate amidinohydrolase [Verticillium dahliae]
MKVLSLLLPLLHSCWASHPPRAQVPLLDNDNVDLTDSNHYSGIRTFANCPSARDPNGASTLVHSPPSHTGPPSMLTSPKGRNPLAAWATVVDCGDAHLTWLDSRVSLQRLDKAHEVLAGRRAANASVSATPRILTLGGDHTTTLSALRSTSARWGPVSVIHFDSHIDTWDPAVLGGDISDYAALNHGTFLHVAHEERLILNSSVHAGVRAPLVRRKGDLRNDARCGFAVVTARDIDALGVQGVVSRIRERVGDSLVYISVDIHVLDPAFAPGTGTAESGGWSTRELLAILDGLEGLPVVGADVVEVAPAYDTNGEITVLAAAEIAYSLVDLMVFRPVKSKADNGK